MQESLIKNLRANNEKKFCAADNLEKCEELCQLQVKLEDENHSKVDSDARAATEVIRRLEEDLEKQLQEAYYLESRNLDLNNINNTLRKEALESTAKLTKDLADTKKEAKKEIKAWKKELGEERKLKIKLEEKLTELANRGFANMTDEHDTEFKPADVSESDVCCTICAEPILVYVPKYSNEIEINPACDDCQNLTNKNTFSVLPTNQDSASVLSNDMDTIGFDPASQNNSGFCTVSMDLATSRSNINILEPGYPQLSEDVPTSP